MTYGSNKAHRPADHHPWRSGWVPKKVERERTCTVCSTTKPIGDYAPSGSGRRTVCRECYNAKRREDEATPEGRAHKRAVDRAHYHRHPHKKVAANRRCRHKKLAEAGRPVVPVPERWYGTVRASLELDISVSWVGRLCQSGELRAVKTANGKHGGLCWRVDPASVAEMKKKRRGLA